MDITVDTTPGSLQPAVLLPALGDHGEQLVAVHDMAALVHDQHAVGVAIERNADVGAHLAHLARQRRQVGGTAIFIDVEAIRIDADGNHVGAQFPQRARRDFVGGAVGAIDDNAQAFERHGLGQRQLGEFDVAILHAVDALGAAEIGAFGELLGEIGIDQLFDLGFHFVTELVAVRSEQLDAVVVERIVRSRDHDAKIGAHRARQHADRRRRDWAGQQHIHADRGEACDQRVLDHVAGQTGVLADQDAVTVLTVPEDQSCGLADLERQFRGNDPVGKATNAVSPEITTNHQTIP